MGFYNHLLLIPERNQEIAEGIFRGAKPAKEVDFDEQGGGGHIHPSWQLRG